MFDKCNMYLLSVTLYNSLRGCVSDQLGCVLDLNFAKSYKIHSSHLVPPIDLTLS